MNEKAPKAPVRLVRDQPSDLQQDEFTHASYVTVLAESLQNAEHPLTLGLFGPWGVGKTSILLALSERLPRDECAFVTYDAWRYDGETLRRHLLRETAAQLREQLGPSFSPDRSRVW